MGKFNYDAPIAGLKALDKYTLQITLIRSDLNFPYILAYVAFAGTAREVIEYYGDRVGQHPVGTGAYQLHKYVPRSRIELTANPNYRGFVWNFKGMVQSGISGLLKPCKASRCRKLARLRSASLKKNSRAGWP